MGTEYTVRHAAADDVDAILELVRLSLGDGKIPREVAYWNWKHRANPFGISPCLVAEANGRVIGLRAFMRWSWRCNGSDVRAVRAVDTATHPEWRGRGIFSQLTRTLVADMEREDVAFVFNTPNASSRPGYLKMGWTSLGRTSLWVRPVRPLATLRSLLGARHDNQRNGAVAQQQSTFHHARAFLERPELTALLDSVPSEGERLTTRATTAYLHWRYVDIPGFEYKASWELDGASSAAVVFRLVHKGAFRELRLCEFVLGPSPGAVARCRRIVRDVVSKAGCDYVAAIAAFGSPEAKVLAGCGFLPTPRIGPILTVRPLTRRSSTPNPVHRSSWRLSIGALELF